VHLACFDLDGTLVEGDSFRRYVFYLHRAHRRRLRGGLAAATVVIQRKCRAITLYEAKRRLLAPLAGLSMDRIGELGDAFWSDVLVRTIRESMLARVRWHQDRGHRVVVLSSTPGAYLAAVERALGLDAAFGTDLRSLEGRFSGQLGQHLFGEAKVRKVNELVNGSPDALVYAYTDHHSDLPLLLRSTDPCVVAPTPRLRREAVRREWPVVDD
jgi:phosphatidylglycerophosphatase C